ncbi:MAG: plastocyanin/azurin family copper-binding protein [Nitrosopumilaceae archaeon]
MILLVSIIPNVFADDTVNISITPDSSVPGCENGIPGVQVTPICYNPSTITVSQGIKVVWTNDDTTAHTVTSGIFYQDGEPTGTGPDGIFDSNLIVAGDSFSYTFDETGEFPYYCLVHPWMIGKVISQGLIYGTHTTIELADQYDTDNTQNFVYRISNTDGLDSIKVIGESSIDYDCQDFTELTFSESELPVTIKVVGCSISDAFHMNLGYFLLDGTYFAQVSTPDGEEEPQVIPENSSVTIEPEFFDYPVEPEFEIFVLTDELKYAFGDSIEIYGKVEPVISGMDVNIIVINPENNLVFLENVPVLDDDGLFLTEISNTDSAIWGTSGTYEVKATYGDDADAQTTFEFDASHVPVPKPDFGSVLVPSDLQNIHPDPNNDRANTIGVKNVPNWIKDDAKLWSTGQLQNHEFYKGIEYLIDEKIIVPDISSKSPDNSKKHIPDWVKNNAKWWANGLIDESEFVNSFKYMIEKGIVRVN